MSKFEDWDDDKLAALAKDAAEELDLRGKAEPKEEPKADFNTKLVSGMSPHEYAIYKHKHLSGAS